MAMVTLVLAAGPGFPQGSPGHRYEVEIALTPDGHPDADAWHADPRPWIVRRDWPGDAARTGDLQLDEEGGWWLRFFPAPGDAADAPRHAILRNVGQLRPGEYVTIAEPDGQDYAYRVVGVA